MFFVKDRARPLPENQFNILGVKFMMSVTKIL